MMMRLVMALVLFTTSSFAETYTVRGGEHSDHTRLVIPFPKGTLPEVQHNPAGRYVSISNLGATLDLNHAFSRISRDRITDISSQSSNLKVALNCHCKVEWYISPDSSVVIDVFSSDAPLRPRARSSHRENTDPAPLPALSWYGNEVGLPAQKSTPKNPLVESVRSQLVGTLTDTVGAIPPASQAKDLATPSAAVGLGLHSPFDRNQTPSRSSTPGFTCPEENTTNPSSWDTGVSFQSAISTTERELGKAETPATKAKLTLELARIYIAAGFGIEAVGILSAQAGTAQSTETIQLMQIARLVDGHEGNAFSQYIACSGSSSIWAILAGADPEDLSQKQKQDVPRAFANFPDALQLRIRERLIGKLRDSGNQQIASILEAYSGNRTAESATLGGDDTVPAGTYLGAQVASISPSEFATLLNTTVEAETPVPEAVMKFSETLLYEMDGEPEATLISEARLNSLLSLGDFSAANDVLVSELSGLQAEQAVRRHYLSEVAKNAPDDRFLEDAFYFAPADYDDELRERVSRRLREAGFIERAKVWNHGGKIMAIDEPSNATPIPIQDQQTVPEATSAEPSLEMLKGYLTSAESLRNTGLGLLN